MYFFISEIGWMFRPHHHPTDFLLWKRRPRPRSSMLPAGRSARTAPARLSHTRAASVRSRPHRTHEGTPGRSAARLLPAPDSRAAAPPHPYRNRTAASYSHALSFPFSLPHKPQQHFVTIVAVLPRRDNFPEAGPSIPWLHFTSRGQCLRLHLITRRPAMFMFVALPVLFIFLE